MPTGHGASHDTTRAGAHRTPSPYITDYSVRAFIVYECMYVCFAVGAHGGKAGRLDRDVVRYPLTKPETYAMLLLEQMCFRAHTVRHHLKFYAEQLASRKRTAEAANMSSCSGASTSAASDELPTLQLPGELLQRTDETSMLTSVIYGAQHGTPGSSSDM